MWSVCHTVQTFSHSCGTCAPAFVKSPPRAFPMRLRSHCCFSRFMLNHQARILLACCAQHRSTCCVTRSAQRNGIIAHHAPPAHPKWKCAARASAALRTDAFSSLESSCRWQQRTVKSQACLTWQHPSQLHRRGFRSG